MNETLLHVTRQDVAGLGMVMQCTLLLLLLFINYYYYIANFEDRVGGATLLIFKHRRMALPGHAGLSGSDQWAWFCLHWKSDI